MNTLKLAIAALAIFTIAGCATQSQDSSSPGTSQPVRSDSSISPATMANLRFQSFSHSAADKTYIVYFKRDRLARADKIVTHVSKGTPFKATSAEDAEVQNMLRDAYRASGRCPEGQHPGLINLGYAPFLSTEGIPAWSAYIRCSDKMQANI